MYRIKEVVTKRDMKKFVDFPLKLYKDCEYYVPAFYGDELGLNNPKKNHSLCDVVTKFWICLDGDEVVGRICAILQKEYNQKMQKKNVRFTRYDVIDDIEVSRLLFNEVYKFANELGMEYVQGPLGFNDVDREGMVIEGFDTLVTFSNANNYAYYKDHMDELGFEKEVDWLEFKIFMPKEVDPRYVKMSELVAKKYNLKDMTVGLSTKQIVDRYGKDIFDLLNRCYAHLHGFVHIKDEVVDSLISSFKLAANSKFISIITDENDKVVAMGVCLSSISNEIRDCKGKLFPFGFIKVLKELRKPKVLELAFLAVDDEYKNRGVHSMIFSKIMTNAINEGVMFAETNSQLEENKRIQAVFKNFDMTQHRRRRCFIKKI